MSTVRHYIDPEAAEELAVLNAHAQQLGREAQAAREAFLASARAVASAMGIKRASQREVRADEQGWYVFEEIGEANVQDESPAESDEHEDHQ